MTVVATIEQQIHRFLKEQEEARCLALEADFSANGVPGKEVKRRPIVSWRRPGPVALCQNPDLLLMISDFDYDLSNRSFQEYCAARGVLHVAGEPGSHRWNCMADWQFSQSSFMNDAYFQFAAELNGERRKFSERDMEVAWEILRLGRATLQDCWELFRGQGPSQSGSL